MKPRKHSRKAGGNGPPNDQPWIWLSRGMLTSLCYRALGISAKRVLDRLLVEHMEHGGAENGRLPVTYLQLTEYGVTRDDIRKGLDELMAAGFVRLTRQGLRQAGGGDPSLYALTWLPEQGGKPGAAPASNEWQQVQRRMGSEGVKTVHQARSWLAANRQGRSRGERKKQVSANRDIESAPQMQAESASHLRGMDNGAVIPFRSQLLTEGGRK